MNPDELNPTNPVVLQMHDNWHKLCACLMVKFGVSEVRLSTADVLKLAEGNINILLDARNERQNGYLTLRLVDDKTARAMASQGLHDN